MPKRPRDVNQLAKAILDIATGQVEDAVSERKRKAEGRAGGIKGGQARTTKLAAEQRHEIASAAAHARWKRS